MFTDLLKKVFRCVWYLVGIIFGLSIVLSFLSLLITLFFNHY